MFGLDTIIEKRITKWMLAGKTDEEIIKRAKTFMWGSLIIHLTLAAIAGWWLYENIKAKHKTTLNLIIPIVVFILALILPYGTERGEELTTICNIISVVVWFTKKSAEEVENK